MESVITDFGARPDGTLATEAINRAIEETASNGSGYPYEVQARTWWDRGRYPCG